MYIRFIKDYKEYKQGKIVFVANAKNAEKLIKKGYAENAGKCFQIKDLYVCDIVKATNKLLGEIKGVQFVRKAIMVHYGEVELSIKNLNTYKHALTGVNFAGANRISTEYYFNAENSLYVDEYNDDKICEFGRYFFDKMMENGWTTNTYLTKAQILELEKELNGTNVKQNEGREC